MGVSGRALCHAIRVGWLPGRTKRLQLQFLVFFDDAAVTPHFTFTRYNNLYIHTDVSETVITILCVVDA